VSPVKYELGLYIPEDGILHSHRREKRRSCSGCERFTNGLEVKVRSFMSVGGNITVLLCDGIMNVALCGTQTTSASFRPPSAPSFCLLVLLETKVLFALNLYLQSITARRTVEGTYRRRRVSEVDTGTQGHRERKFYATP
jgi:hypothetical protein